MRLGASRSRLYDAQKTARVRWDALGELWADEARTRFDESAWLPLDRAVSDVLRAIDQLVVQFAEIRRDCEYTP